MDEADQITLANAQKATILSLLEQEDEAALHRRLVEVQPSLLEDEAESFKAQLILPLVVSREHVQEVALVLWLLQLLSDDKLHFLLLLGAEIHDASLDLLHDEKHDLHSLSRSRLVNEYSSCGACISFIVGDRLPVLLV